MWIMAVDDDRFERAAELTRAFLDAPWTVELVGESGAACFDHWPGWMPALAQRVVAVFRVAPLERRGELFALILEFLESHAEPAELTKPAVRHEEIEPSAAVSAPRASLPEWPVPVFASVPDLAERLELSDGQLAWLADIRGLERTVEREQVRNYRYLTVPRRGAMPRLIEAPKMRLKEVQRWILREILSEVPSHPAAHGFVPGRSAVTHAELHTGQRAVLRLDLKDFFASVPAARIHGIWRALGYQRSIAHVLTGLTTNAVPVAVWQRVAQATSAEAVQSRFRMGRQLATPHLPQGAPTSPALANLAAFRLDRRLAGLARATGLSYSRYADDLTFSGPARLIRRRSEFEAVARAIIRAEGFRLNDAKALAQASGGRQTVCGVVVNARTNVRRTDYDELRAILHNAARMGPASQNHGQVEDFRAHLLGRISWVQSLNPARGQRLHELFAAIDWS
jgi:RNA-directed DNA polymerase